MNKFRVVLAACAGVALSLSVGASFASAAGGTISGTVKYDGTAPAPKPVEVTKDKEVCGLHQHFQEDLIVGSGGGIANAVVIVKGAKGDMKPGDVTFDQKGCDYVPHVLAFEAGSTVKIVNSDGILHNIHTYSEKNPSFNMAQPKFKKVIEQKIDTARSDQGHLRRARLDARMVGRDRHAVFRGDGRQGQLHDQGCAAG